jgi:hypothetical protein
LTLARAFGRSGIGRSGIFAGAAFTAALIRLHILLIRLHPHIAPVARRGV